MEQRVVGVLGAGQLGRMFVEAAARLNVQVRLLDVGDTAPAKQINYLPGRTASRSTSMAALPTGKDPRARIAGGRADHRDRARRCCAAPKGAR